MKYALLLLVLLLVGCKSNESGMAEVTVRSNTQLRTVYLPINKDEQVIKKYIKP